MSKISPADKFEVSVLITIEASNMDSAEEMILDALAEHPEFIDYEVLK